MSHTQNTESLEEIKEKRTWSLELKEANRWQTWYRKHHPELPTLANGKRYNPKFKYNALALELEIGESWIFPTCSKASGFVKALQRHGFSGKIRTTNQGFKVTKEVLK